MKDALVRDYKESLKDLCEDKVEELLLQAQRNETFTPLRQDPSQRPLVTRMHAMRILQLLARDMKRAAALLCHLDPGACQNVAAAVDRLRKLERHKQTDSTYAWKQISESAWVDNEQRYQTRNDPVEEITFIHNIIRTRK